MFYILIGIVIGFILPFQTLLNGKLSHISNSALVSSFISFFIGTIPLFILTRIIEQSIFFDTALLSLNHLWLFSGTIIGVIYVTGITMLFNHLGAVQSVILPILGQIIMGLLTDTFGLFHTTAIPLTHFKLLGALFVTLGILGTVLFKKGERQTHTHTTHHSLWQIIGVFLGVIVAIQTTLNAQLGVLMQSGIKTSLWAFIIGTIILFIAVLSKGQLSQLSTLLKSKTPAYYYLGGTIGCLFLTCSIFITTFIGTGLSIMANLIGLTAGGLFIEHFGLLNSSKNKINLLQLFSLLFMLIGIYCIQFL